MKVALLKFYNTPNKSRSLKFTHHTVISTGKHLSNTQRKENLCIVASKRVFGNKEGC